MAKNSKDLDDCDGQARWKTEYKHVVIHLASDQNDKELEETLVHELIHVLLEAHKNEPKNRRYDPLYERGLNVLSENLVSRKRRG
jgi:Zn-dependent peptidase ImmA (M78 family)